MAMWNRCTICGRAIPIGELCYGVKNWRGDPTGGDTICRDCLVPENAPTLKAPNEPLTEEQLKKMIGTPVWIESARRSEWMLLWGYHGPEVYGGAFIFTRRTAQKEQFPFSELGVTWWPYRFAPDRRPPEGEEETP